MMQDWNARETLSAVAMHGLLQAGGDSMGAALLARRACEIADALIAENRQRNREDPLPVKSAERQGASRDE